MQLIKSYIQQDRYERIHVQKRGINMDHTTTVFKNSEPVLLPSLRYIKLQTNFNQPQAKD